jgi:hypothetical protein
MIQFTPIQIHPQRPTYGAIMGEYTFVITLTDNGKFHASVKRLGAKKFDGTRKDLGNFHQFNKAAHACETYWRNHQQ